MKKALTVGRRTGEGRRFSGEYAADGKAVRLAARAAAGHRCIRCGHPFESGKHGRGEWSPCDQGCTHGGPIRTFVKGGDGWVYTEGQPAFVISEFLHDERGIVDAKWRILTVHHLDGGKANDAWWNLLSLCQRCHLEIQGKVDPRIPWLFEHSEWIKPFVGGFLAKKYLGLDLEKYKVIHFKDELASLESRSIQENFQNYLSDLRARILGLELPHQTGVWEALLSNMRGRGATKHGEGEIHGERICEGKPGPKTEIGAPIDSGKNSGEGTGAR